MNIWVDANGWPIPPTVLLGCLVAEILYFRGWRLLVKAEQAKESSTINRAPTMNRGATRAMTSVAFSGSAAGE